jgi:sortase A
MPYRPGVTFWRAVNLIGRALLGAGVLVLLFVAYQLWGTGLQESRAQASLDRELEALFARASAAPTTAPPTTTTPTTTTPTTATPTTTGPTTTGPTTTGPTTTTDRPGTTTGTGPGRTTTTTVAPTTTTAAPDLTAVLALVRSGDAIARLEIPKIGVDKVVVEGVQTEELRKGPGHYRSTPLPGQPGNAAIAGHRTTYGAPFADIDQLQPGDEIIATTPQGRFVYKVKAQKAADGSVSGHFIVSPTALYVLDQTEENLLTLTACHPKYSASQRIVVQAVLVDTPAASTPRPATEPGLTEPADPIAGESPTEPGTPAPVADATLDQGLGSDNGAWGPTAMWAITFSGLATLTWWALHAERRRRGFLAAAVLCVPMVLALFALFENLDRALPTR